MHDEDSSGVGRRLLLVVRRVVADTPEIESALLGDV